MISDAALSFATSTPVRFGEGAGRAGSGGPGPRPLAYSPLDRLNELPPSALPSSGYRYERGAGAGTDLTGAGCVTCPAALGFR